MMKSTLLTTLSVAAVLCSTQAAQAQEEGRGNRWKFAPTIYKLEQPVAPHGYGQHNVVSNKPTVVQSRGFDMNDPFFQKPARPLVAPVAQTATHANFGFAQPAGQLMSTPVALFNKAFGTPLVAKALPPMAVPQQRSMTAPAQKLASKPASRSSVSGTIRRPAVARGNSGSAASMPTIASYGAGNGYTPGAHTVSSGGSGSSASTYVQGKLIRRN